MTSKWDKFDVEKALDDVDKEDEKEKRLKNDKVVIKQQEKVLADTKRNAEILETKEAMKLLRARRSAASKPQVSDVKRDATENPLVILTSMLTKLGDNLMNLSTMVNKLGLHMEKRIHSQLGFQQTLEVLGKFNSFVEMQLLFQHTIRRLPIDKGVHASVVETIESSMQSLDQSKCFVQQQLLYALAYFAFHMGRYALVADTCRILLVAYREHSERGRRYGVSFGCDVRSVWLLRGLAFAGINCPHLSLLHFQSAIRDENAGFKLDGYQECCDYLNQEVLRRATEAAGHRLDEEGMIYDAFVHAYAHYLYYEAPQALCGMRRKFLLALHPFSALHVSDLQALLTQSPLPDNLLPQKDKLFLPLCKLLGFSSKACNTSMNGEDGALKGEEQSPVEAVPKSEECPQSGNSDSVTKLALTLARKLFYEAQLLVIEGYHNSAMTKYHLVARILQACCGFPLPGSNSLHSSSACDDANNATDALPGTREYWVSVYACTLVNLASSVAAKFPNIQLDRLFLLSPHHNVSRGAMGRVSQGLKEALEYTALARTLFPHPLILLRHGKILERLGRFAEASEVVAELRALVLAGNFQNGIVENHMQWNAFTQLHLLDLNHDRSLHCLNIRPSSTAKGEAQSDGLVRHLLAADVQEMKFVGVSTAEDRDSLLKQMKAYQSVLDKLITESSGKPSSVILNKQFDPVPPATWEGYLLSWEHSLAYKHQRYPVV